MKILALESSCDDSSIAFFDPSGGFFYEESISQISVHRPYGGVVPELATEAHLKNLPRLLANWRRAMADVRPDAVAVTVGPGLVGGLAMGLAAARTVALALRCPVLGVNHLHGHALSPFISTPPDRWESLLPHLGLLVSGGNTLLFSIGRHWHMQTIAATVDDAAGEALDKGARLLGLPYPGGVSIEVEARGGNAAAHAFPRAFPGPEWKFSFSGLKTSLLRCLREMDREGIAAGRADLCASYQEAVFAALLRKVRQAIRAFPHRSLGLSGGVAQNATLREKMRALADEVSLPLLTALPCHCGDNASMIAFAAALDPLTRRDPREVHPKLLLGQTISHGRWR
jgi:N6-L-threonylcarbamoyladenine synthase